MGVETIFPAGTVLTRKEKKNDEEDVVRVVGTGDKLVVTPHEGFGSNRELRMDVARRDYTAEYPEGIEFARIPPVGDRGLSPEQVFARDASKPGATTKRIRKGTKVDDKAVIE